MRAARNISVVGFVTAVCCVVLNGCSDTKPAGGAAAPPAADAAVKEVVLSVRGMHCDGCAQTIAEAVRPLPGVQSVTVSFQDKRAIIVPTGADFDPQSVIAVIEKAGYEASIGDSATPPATTGKGDHSS